MLLLFATLLAGAVAGADMTPPRVVQLIPPADSANRVLDSVEVFFDEEVRGVQANDLLVNDFPAEMLEGSGAAQYVFRFSSPLPGLVRFTWAVGHGIQDREGNPFDGGAWTVTLDPDFGIPRVVISEFMAVNTRTTNDLDGDSSDWIELFNLESYAVNLDGWFLTDSTNNLTRWRLPNYVLPGRGLLLVWASEKNRTNVGAPLHTNFKLDKAGEYLALLDARTNVVSEFAPRFPAQSDDVSFGRDPLDPALVGFYATPTPGRLNTGSGAASFAPDVVFSTNSGTFIQPFPLALNLKMPMSNAVIRYALGTNAPTTNSALYTAPLLISNTVQVRARAFAPGLLPGDVHSEQFIELHPNVLSFTSDLPLMILHNHGGGAVPVSADQFGMAQTFEPVNGRSSLTNAPTDRAPGIFHKRGSSTITNAKASFFFEARNELGDDKDESLLGLPAESDWVLYAPNEYDRAMIHNPVAYELARRTGRYASRTRFVVLFLKDSSIAGRPITTNDYHGIYVLEEKVKAGKDRVDIAKLDPGDNSLPDVSGGYLLSIDRPAPGETKFTGAGQPMNYIEPRYAEMISPPRAAQRQYLSNFFNSFDVALNSPNWTNPVTGYAAHVDVDSWIDYHLNAVVTRNIDAVLYSTFLYKPRDGKLHFGPMWDCDRSQGSDGRDFNPRVWNCGTSADHFGYSWWGRVLTDPNFWQRWIDRYQELRETAFATSNVVAAIDGFASQVRQEQPRDVARWGVAPRSGTVTGACGFTHNFGAGGFDGEIAWLKRWFSNRFDFIDSELLARPRLSRTGGMIATGTTLTIAGPPGASIYYTLDGTDPRALHGGLAVNARLYSGAITLTNNVRVVARCRDLAHRNQTGGKNPPISSPWSGPIAATCFIALPPLLVTEIMYHPPDPLPPETRDADDFEFIELRNAGTSALDLIGFRFTNGLEFTFTSTNSVTALGPGEYVVLVKDRAAFAARYPGVTNVAGEFSGQLDNAGERLALIGPLGEPVADFIYDDAWFTETDGGGGSLLLIDDSVVPANYSASAVWRASAVTGGTPGRPNESPRLHITRAGQDVILTWPATPPATLFSAGDLASPNWTALPGATTNVFGQMSYTSSLMGVRRFFQLRVP